LSIEQYGPGDVGTRNQRYNVSNTIAYQPMLSYVRGTHSLKFGGDFRDIRVNASSGSFVFGGGQFTFNRGFTSRVPNITEANAGNAIATLLLGYPASGGIEYTPRLAYRWGYYGGFIQDDWRITDRFTVNLGLRWDMEGAATERYNRMNRGFASGAADPALAAAARNVGATDCPACANLTGGLLFAGANGQPREAFNTDYDHWQPRIGAAYKLTDRTVLRGGFGVYYLPQAFFGGVAGFGQTTSFQSALGGNEQAFIPSINLNNPFPNGILGPGNGSAGLATFAGQNVVFVNPDREISRANQWSFGIQHQLPGSIRIDASYVGSRTYDVNTGDNQTGGARNINVNSAEQLARARQDPTYFSTQVANPFRGLLPGSNLNTQATIARQNLLRPFPQFNDVVIVGESVGKIWYDAFQLSVEKRYTQGLTAVLAYTWSKNLEAIGFINNQDAAPTKNLTASDRPHRLVVSGVYELPFGRGKAFGSDIGRGWNMLVGGWEYNFIGIMQSGTPTDLPGGVDIIGNIQDTGNFGQWFNGCVANASGVANCSNPAWQLRGANTLRTTPFRAGWIRNPTRPLWDMSLNKRVIFGERTNLQFRFETFNTFNSVQRGGPITDPTRPDFGQVLLGQSNIPRQVQLGFKFNF
jgi:hypothetical protein